MEWHGWYIPGAFMIVCAVVSVVRLVKGKGLALGFIPESQKERVNLQYKRRGWDEPFNEDGTKKSDRF